MVSPENPPTTDHIDAMRLGVDYRFPISCRKFTMLVRPLSITEQVQVAASVQEKFAMLPPLQQNALAEHSLLAQETLITASTTEPGSKDPKLTEAIIGRMTPEEINHMFKQYVAAVDRANPSLELMDREKVDLLVAELKKNPETELVPLLTSLSFTQLVSLARHLLTLGE